MKSLVNIFIIVVLILVGFAAPAEAADITVSYNVTNPNFSIISTLTDHQTGNSNTTTVECSAVGSGYSYGELENNINIETGWNTMAGGFYGSEVDMSSTFQVQSYRNVEGTSSTFDTRQTVSATNVGPLQFTSASQLISGMFLYGEGGACDTTDTWALGLGHTFEGTPETATGTADNLFEQRDPTGALIGTPVDNHFTVDTAGGDWFSGVSEGGSYESSAFGLSPVPDVGFTASSFSFDIQNGSSTTDIDVLHYSEVVGDSATWYDYPGYTSP